MPTKPQLPQSVYAPRLPFVIDDPGWWLLLGDIHLPFHDQSTIHAAVKLSKKNKIKGIILNGDILDWCKISRFRSKANGPTIRQEVLSGWQFLAYLRYQFPTARIIWKDGNHDERLEHFAIDNGFAELVELERQDGKRFLCVETLLQLDNFGAEYVTDGRVILFDRLHIFHGHELRVSGKRPALNMWNKTKVDSICGHVHRTDEYAERNFDKQEYHSWTVGCACGLSPDFFRFNDWNHGFALIYKDKSSGFDVKNLRVIGGAVQS